VGTIPQADFPLAAGAVELNGQTLRLGEHRLPVQRGTAALLAAAAAALNFLGAPPPFAYLVGDTGRGDGSRRLYRYLADRLAGSKLSTLTFHYIQPDVDWHNRVLFALQAMNPRPMTVADAGFMYVAKMSGQAEEYDLFTPDAGELAFLADETAPHPFYTRGFILQEEDRAPELIARAYEHRNAARYLLVKGRVDYLANAQGVLAEVAAPQIEALEAMGGTGDTLTGLAAALLEAGLSVPEAAVGAARANRLAGALAQPNPATQVGELIARLPQALAALG
jgi:hypothetical protein